MTTIDETPTSRRAAAHDRADLVRVLTAAFLTDPVFH